MVKDDSYILCYTKGLVIKHILFKLTWSVKPVFMESYQWKLWGFCLFNSLFFTLKKDSLPQFPLGKAGIIMAPAL